MTIKKRLFLSNLFMLLIPAMVSVLILAVSLLFFVNVVYKQVMDETVREENTVHLEEIQLQIYQGDAQICSMGTSTQALASQSLQELSSSTPNGSLYMEQAEIEGISYTIYLFFSAPVKESAWNELIVKYWILVLLVLIVAAVLVTNQFLTKFVFRKIEKPLDLLVSGVHEIQNGNLTYRIVYKEKDEFLPVFKDFNQMAERLQQSIEQIEREDRKELIAGISHDLRTPLTSIKAYIEGLIEGIAQTPERQQKYMQTIREKANDIDRMVDKLFLFSKLDLGDSPFYPEPISVAEALNSLISENAEAYAKQGMTITLEEIPEACTVYADPVQFRNAITNLLENSLKYKDAPEVQVRIRCTETDSDATIIVSDNGPGVPEEALPKLFDVFYRSDPARSNPQSGSGLGLAITAKILERFGGSIRAEQETPKGLRILLTIPKKGVET